MSYYSFFSAFGFSSAFGFTSTFLGLEVGFFTGASSCSTAHLCISFLIGIKPSGNSLTVDLPSFDRIPFSIFSFLLKKITYSANINTNSFPLASPVSATLATAVWSGSNLTMNIPLGAMSRATMLEPLLTTTLS